MLSKSKIPSRIQVDEPADPFTFPRFCPPVKRSPVLFISSLVVLAGFLAGVLPPPAAADAAGQKAMQAVHDQFRQKPNQQADVKLVIEDDSGAQRVRYFRSLYKIFPERSKSLVKFYRPPSMRGTGLLSESKNGERDSSQWLYLPALRSVKQLSAGDRHKSFMGSDFTHADIAGRQVNQDQHTLIEQSSKMIVIRSVPYNDSDPYGAIETHIMRTLNVPRRVIFYDRKGQKIKTLTNKEIRKIAGMYVITRAEMENHRTGGNTKLEKEEVDVESTINPQDVGFKGLRH